MFPLLGGLITGGMNLLGGMFSSDTSAQNTQAQIAGQQAMQRETQTFNAGEAEKTRAYQTQMSNTAYQRASDDMQAAGLNPAMMFSKGDAASSPAGATASVSTPTMPTPQNTHPMANIGRAAESAMNTAIAVKTYDKMTEEIANLRATESKIKADTAVSQATEPLRRQETETEKAETLRRQNVNSILGLSMPGHRVSARQAEAVERLPNWMFDIISQGSWTGKHTSEALRPLSDIISSAKGVNSMLPKSGTRSREYSSDGSFDEFWSNRTGWSR